MTETHARSLVKGATWRLTAMMDTMLIAWLVTGSVSTALKIASIETFTKIFLFYLHERIWGKIHWKKKENAHSRSLAKGMSWRVTGTIDTIIISSIVTGHIPKALQIGGVEVVTKVSLYYLHERLWARIPWGTTTTPTRMEPTPQTYQVVQS